jgi:hypothetical protein
MGIQIDLATSQYGTPFAGAYFGRYHADLLDVEAANGATFLDKCYSWVMTQDYMSGSVAV